MARSKVLNFFLVLNALLLISCVSVIGVLYTKLDAKMGKLDAFSTQIQENPGAFSEMVAKWVQAVASESFLGVSDGELSHFMSNEFAINASKLSREVTDMSNFLMDRFDANNHNCSAGTQLKCGDRTGFVECPPGNQSNPRTFYCRPGEVFTCGGDTSCVAPSIHTVASAAKGGARLLQDWQTVGNSATVFRLDLLTEWVGAQMNTKDWKSAVRALPSHCQVGSSTALPLAGRFEHCPATARSVEAALPLPLHGRFEHCPATARSVQAALAQACVTAANQVKNTDWRGTYFMKDRLKTWEANREVREVANYILQVCQPMAA